MGVLAAPHRRSPWAQDPEALIVFTLEIARWEPRLFDELLDWMLTNEALLSIRRLRAMCIDDTDRALVAAAIGWIARRRPRARLRAEPPDSNPHTPQPLFHDGGTVPETDPDFAAAGLLRPPLAPSGKSLAPDFVAPINLGFRLRAILGVGIRAEIVRIMLNSQAPGMSAYTLARASVYAKRNVHEALTSLTSARVVAASTINGEQRYTIDRAAWAALLQTALAELPCHRNWPQLLGTLRTILRWTQQAELQNASNYLRASSARQLLDRIRPELAFAGIAIEPHPTVETAPRHLQIIVERTLAALNQRGESLVGEGDGFASHEVLELIAGAS
jgi:hypothetical protein